MGAGIGVLGCGQQFVHGEAQKRLVPGGQEVHDDIAPPVDGNHHVLVVVLTDPGVVQGDPPAEVHLDILLCHVEVLEYDLQGKRRDIPILVAVQQSNPPAHAVCIRAVVDVTQSECPLAEILKRRDHVVAGRRCSGAQDFRMKHMPVYQIRLCFARFLRTVESVVVLRIDQNGKDRVSGLANGLQQRPIVLRRASIFEEHITGEQFRIRVLEQRDCPAEYGPVPAGQVQNLVAGVVDDHVDEVRRHIPFADQAIAQAHEPVHHLAVAGAEGSGEEQTEQERQHE